MNRKITLGMVLASATVYAHAEYTVIGQQEYWQKYETFINAFQPASFSTIKLDRYHIDLNGLSDSFGYYTSTTGNTSSSVRLPNSIQGGLDNMATGWVSNSYGESRTSISSSLAINDGRDSVKIQSRNDWKDILQFNVTGPNPAVHISANFTGTLTSPFAKSGYVSAFYNMGLIDREAYAVANECSLLGAPCAGTIIIDQTFDHSLTFNKELTLDVVLPHSGTYYLMTSMQAFAADGGSADISHTGKITSITTSPGVTITSASGGLQFDGTQYSYIAAVPEPEIYAMMMAGLGIVGAVSRRRKQKLAA